MALDFGPEFIPQKDGTYRWHPTYGKEYNIGYFHRREGGIGMFDKEEIHATYLGVMENDRGKAEFVFFKEGEGELLRYASPVSVPVWWQSDGDDEPSFPTFQASFSGEILDGPIK